MGQKITRMLILCVVFALSFYIHGVKADVSFSLRDTSNGAYKTFIKALRQQLTVNTNKVYGIPVLKFHTKTDNERFILINLTNSEDNLVTLAMDVFNASIVAYRTKGLSFFFQDAPELAQRVLFAETNRSTLPYSSSYDSLAKRSVFSRAGLPLGFSALNDAIFYLFNNNDTEVPPSFIVLNQMISEAARFKFIEQTLQNNIINNQDKKPSQTMTKLEDYWSQLSKQIQISLTLEGLFLRTDIEIPDLNGFIVPIDNIGSPIVSGIALLLYQCTAGNNNTDHGAPRLIDGELKIIEASEYNKSCQMLSNRMARIGGRDGLCVDGKNGMELWTCGEEKTQQWTFQDDGTIHSGGKCVTASGYSPGNYVVLDNCRAEKPAMKWILSPDGTITNPHSGLVLTAPSAVEGSNLTLESNTGAASQGWRAEKEVFIFETSIVGLNDMCFEGIDYKRVDLAKCDAEKTDQMTWKLYVDGTIRVNDDPSFCITSESNTKSSLIGIKKCEGSSNQRWVFKTDGTIFNPNSNMVMDVRENNATLHQIILYPFNNNANQQWVLMF